MPTDKQSHISSCATVHSVYILCLPVIYTCSPSAKEPLWTSSYPIRAISPYTNRYPRRSKLKILSGALAAGAKLPSIRALASDLGVSVITTKRAYADLEQLGFICTVQGKGCFVAEGNQNSCAKTSSAISKICLRKRQAKAETPGCHARQTARDARSCSAPKPCSSHLQERLYHAKPARTQGRVAPC